MNQSVLSTQYVKVPVSAQLNGNAYNPTGDTVQLAFVAVSATPQSGDWNTGQWETAGTTYYAECLVGPANSGVALAVGTYAVWVKVTDNPEVPVMQAGTLTIF